MNGPFSRPATIILLSAFGALAAFVGSVVAEGILALAPTLGSDRSSAPPTPGADPISLSPRSDSPALSKEFDERLAPRAARTGDIQIALLWDNTNDLDLHCTGPDGHEIYPGTKDAPSPTGGTMDLDANASCYAAELTNTPVENIYWPAGRAPAGTYRVHVSTYQRCEPTTPNTKFRVSVLANGRRSELDGSITHTERNGKLLVGEFTVERQSPAPAPEGTAPASSPTDNTPAPTKPVMRPSPVWYGLWAVPPAAGVAVALLAAQSYFARRKPRLTLTHGAIAIAAAGAGFVGTWLGQLLDHQLHSNGAPGVGSAVGWVLLASFTVLLVSSAPPKVDVKKRALAGLVGGALAVGAFFTGTTRAEWVGRALGGIVVGASCGVAVGAAAGRRAESASPPATNKPPSLPPAVAPAPPPAPAPPAAPRPRPTALPAPSASKPALAPDACPYCRNGTKHPGAPGSRYCIVHERTY